jgi:hypothetical protein
MNSSDTLKGNLRFLIASTSSEEVYNTLTQIFKEDYAFLQKLYAKPDKLEVPKKAQASVPVSAELVATSPPIQEEAPKIRADTKVRIVKKPTAVADLPVEVPVAATVPEAVVHTESGFRDPKDIKKWQKEQEDNKAAELRAAGINPVSLLTEANMRKWVVDEKKTFAAIAREYVGLSDGVIASEAKKYGLQSDVARRRAAILGAKKAK